MRPETDNPWQAIGLGEEPRWFQNGYTGGLTAEETAGGVGTTGTLVGSNLYDPVTGNFIGRLRSVAPIEGSRLFSKGGLFLYRQPIGGQPGGYTPFTGGTYATETGQLVTVDPSGKIGLRRTIPREAAPAAPAYSSTRQAAEEERAFQREEAARRAREDIELENIRAANDRRNTLINQLNDFAQTGLRLRADYRNRLMDLEAQTRNILSETLGKDVVRGALRGQGVLPRGVTPTEGFRTTTRIVGEQAGRKAAELGAPLAGPNLEADEAGLAAQIAAQQAQNEQYARPLDLRAPEPMVFAGLAEGGVMMGGGDGRPLSVGGQPVAQPGTAGYGVIVGDREINGDEELIHMMPTPMGPVVKEVIPIAGRAQGGASFAYSPTTVKQVLGPVYDYLGFSQPPMFRQEGVQGTFGAGGESLSTEALARLGVRPQLVRFGRTPEVYLRDAASNQLRHISNQPLFERMGYQFPDVVSLEEGARPQFAFGAPITEVPSAIEPGVSRRRFPPSPEPLFIREDIGGQSGLRGLAGFVPESIAALLPTLDAETQQVILSLLGVIGYSPESISQRLRYFTPQGTGRFSGAAMFG